MELFFYRFITPSGGVITHFSEHRHIFHSRLSVGKEVALRIGLIVCGCRIVINVVQEQTHEVLTCVIIAQVIPTARAFLKDGSQFGTRILDSRLLHVVTRDDIGIRCGRGGRRRRTATTVRSAFPITFGIRPEAVTGEGRVEAIAFIVHGILPSIGEFITIIHDQCRRTRDLGGVTCDVSVRTKHRQIRHFTARGRSRRFNQVKDLRRRIAARGRRTKGKVICGQTNAAIGGGRTHRIEVQRVREVNHRPRHTTHRRLGGVFTADILFGVRNIHQNRFPTRRGVQLKAVHRVTRVHAIAFHHRLALFKIGVDCVSDIRRHVTHHGVIQQVCNGITFRRVIRCHQAAILRVRIRITEGRQVLHRTRRSIAHIKVFLLSAQGVFHRGACVNKGVVQQFTRHQTTAIRRSGGAFGAHRDGERDGTNHQKAQEAQHNQECGTTIRSCHSRVHEKDAPSINSTAQGHDGGQELAQ